MKHLGNASVLLGLLVIAWVTMPYGLAIVAGLVWVVWWS